MGFVCLFILERERERVSTPAGEGQRQRETQNLKQAGCRLGAVSTEPDVGLELRNCEITA